MFITVFTPTYNRAHLLNRLYNSLCQQSFEDFEWLIVDDGSTDNTSEIVKSFIYDNIIHIKYIKQENGGKHRAINHGVRMAKGELFFIVDSDDVIPNDSLCIIYHQYQAIKLDPIFAGVVGYIAHRTGEIVGYGCNLNEVDCSPLDFWCKYKGKGDMAEVFKTEVLKEFPFPEIDGEKFCPEELIWIRISRKYVMRYFKTVIYYRDYLDGGLTDKIIEIRMNSPISTLIDYSEYNSMDIPIIKKVKTAINYWRFRFCVSKRENESIPHISYKWIWTIPFGYLMHINDVRKTQ